MATVNLHRAQDVAKQSMQTNCFERHTSYHISNTIGGCIEVIETGINAVVSCIRRVVEWFFSVLVWFCPCLEALYPVNPINGKRHLVLVPRVIERTLGNWLYEAITFGMAETNRAYEGTTSINDKVQNIFKKIKEHNAELLAAKTEDFPQGYEYRVKVVNSSMVNAFAVAGGGMVVFTEIIKEIRDAVVTDRNKNVEVHFADGSKASVDLSAVSADDVIAALLGHEMTHVASRHSLVQLVLVLVLSLILNAVRTLIAGVLGEESSMYRTLLYTQDLIMQYLLNYQSRVHEYEADVTGVEFMKNADYNPLGALYLQEILTRMHRNGCMDWLHHRLEFLFTHPYGEHRKRALFAALSVLDEGGLREKAKLSLAATNLDTDRASPGVCFAKSVKNRLGLRNIDGIA